jgi:hypothetical protein
LIAGVYTLTDYLIAVWIVGSLVLWLLFEFLGAVRAWHAFKARLFGSTPASAHEAAQRVTEASYAATRNARQDLGGRNGKKG